MNTDRRYQAGRPYYRPANKYQPSEMGDRLFAFAITLMTGAALGATVALLVVQP